jgi:hypothetical protein
VTTRKGGRLRCVPLTIRLAAALRDRRHLRSSRVLCQQELAGHRELGMTQRYMHLGPAALDSAIRLLDQPLAVQSFGDILETGRVSEGKVNG